MDKRNRKILNILVLTAVLPFVQTPIRAETGGAQTEQRVDIGNISIPSGSRAVMKPSKPMELLSQAEAADLEERMADYTAPQESLLINRAEHFYYYENLDPLTKELYDVLYQVAQDPVSEGNIGFMMTDMDPSGDEFYFCFNKAYRSLCFDHPELFWLYSGEEAGIQYYSEAVNMGGFYLVYFMMEKPFRDFEKQMNAFNQAAESFLRDIDTSKSEYDVVRQIHDKLIDLVNYNDPVAEHMYISMRGQDLAHTAYGALVEDSHGKPNYAVCDGYSLAFEYLLQQCGIEAVFIGGKGGSTPETAGGHAWSMVKMNGSWYETDTTWDDSGSSLDDFSPIGQEYKYLTEALENSTYRQKIDHCLFLVSTDTMSHFIPGPEYDYVTSDQKYVFSLAQESYHIRLGEMTDAMDFDSAIISLAPVAAATYQ